MTVLDMTQSILSSLDSDEVNSISDSVEARQVAECLRTSFFNMIVRANLPEHNRLFSLVASGDSEQPVLMLKPDNVSKIEWIKYNIATEDDPDINYSYVTILPVSQFLDHIHQFNIDENEVESFVLDDNTFYYYNDRRPNYCTIIRDYYIIFDAYDNEVDSTLQESKTECYGRVVPTFSMTDSFIPDLDDQQFPLLLNEAKSLAFLELKQVNHELAIRESKRQWGSLQKNKHIAKTNHFDELPNFGRRGYHGFRV